MKKLTLLQLLIVLEAYGVIDIYVIDGSITLITIHPVFDPPQWLRDEYDLHRDDLLRMLRKVRKVPLLVGVF